MIWRITWISNVSCPTYRPRLVSSLGFNAALRKVPASDGTPQLSDLQSCSLPAYCCPGFGFFHSFTWMPADAGLSHQRTNTACITNSLFSPAKSKHWILLGSLSTIQFYADRPFNFVLVSKYYDTDDICLCHREEADQMFHTRIQFGVTSDFSPLSVISE